jgi:methylmalonyl-CoA/ethylmalonyl-CoA epimerase
MKVLKIDHLSNQRANQLGRKAGNSGQMFLGLKTAWHGNRYGEKVTTAFFSRGSERDELLVSTSPDGPIAKFIEKNGGKGGFQHVAFQVENIDEALAELQEKGVALIDKTPRMGAGGCKIAYLHPKATGGILVELSQRM